MSAATSPDAPCQPPDAARAVVGLGDAAVRAVADAIARRQAGALPFRGADGRLPTEHELRTIVDFLEGALATGAPQVFADYVRWVASELASHGAPAQSFSACLDALQAFLDERLMPEHRGPVRDVIAAGRQALATARRPDATIYGVRQPAALPRVDHLVSALLTGDVARARTLAFDAWGAEGDYVRVATRLFQPALYEVGWRWQRRQATVAQEHLATAICQTLLTQLYLTAALFVAPIDRTAVFAAVAGNGHALGLRIVSDAFDLAGWSVQHLGADTPSDDLIAHIDVVRPDVVGLSASMVQQLPTLRRVVERLKTDLGTRCPTILVGGLPTNRLARSWQWIGADVWCPDAEAAVREML